MEPSPEPNPAPPPVPPAPSESPAAPRKVRWKLALGVVAVGLMVIGYLRFVSQESHQNRNLATLATSIVTGLALMVWLLFLSRLPWRQRGRWFLGVVGVGIVLATMFELKGFTGDMRPILRWRWAKRVTLPQTITPAVSTAKVAAAGTEIHGQVDFPQFMGPNRNATVSNDFVPARDWQEHPPALLWRQAVGAAWSGCAIRGSIAITQEQRGDQEVVAAYDLTSGKPLWLHADATMYATKIAGEGPRATPTISGDRVLAMGATGWLNCLELATGKVLWAKNVVDENHGQKLEWGVSCSPLVLGANVIVNPGGKGRSLVAYRLSDGEFVWGGGDDKAGYSSPVAGPLAGREQVLIFNHAALFGHDAATGAVLWQHAWPTNHPHIALPVILPGDRVLVSSGYGYGSELLQVAAAEPNTFTATRLWKSNRLKTKFNNFIVHEGYIYGLDDGILTCLELTTGELKWKDGRYGHGQFIFTGGLLLLMAEDGDVVLIEPVPTNLHELTRFTALTGKTWNPPALAGDLLLVRNDQEAACFRLPGTRRDAGAK